MRNEWDEESTKIYVDALAQWRYHWNPKENKSKEIERLLKQLKRSENKISLKLDEIEKMKSENNFDSESSTLEKQAVALEQITGKNNIDIKTTTVKKWIEISKLAQRINAERQKISVK